MTLTRIRLLPLIWLVLMPPLLLPGGETDYQKLGHEHFFNLEYNEAITAYQHLIRQAPLDPRARNYLAVAVLYKELLRLGMLETSAFRGDNQFLDREKPEPDPAARARFLSLLQQARDLAQKGLERDPENYKLRYSLAANYGLQANYQFMIEKSYLAALRNGSKANKQSRILIEQHPELVDAYLVAGVYEYVVGSLPWAVRALIAVGGIRGDKNKGRRYVAQVAREGTLARDEARALLTILLRRERRPVEAAEVLTSIIQDFPRNYVLHLELAAMHLAADEKERALEVFRNVRRKVEANQDRFGRMPARARQALGRKIKQLEEELPLARN